MRRLAELNQTRVGAVGIVLVAALLAAAFNIGKLRSLLTGSAYSAAFAEAGGLRGGEDVRISGYTVGKVSSVRLDGDHVRVDFTTDGTPLGTRTRASIKTANVLGTKFLQLHPEGAGTLESGAQIPLSRTTSPYDVTEALSDLTLTAGEIDTARLAKSFDTLAATFADTPPQLRAALEGVRRLSTVIAARDEALRRLLGGANGVSKVLADRNAQIVGLMSDGSLLLAEIQARRQTIGELLVNLRRAADQLSGFVKDNRERLGPVLTELRKILKVLDENVGNIEQAIKLLGPYARGLGESVGGGPFFYAYIQNLAPTNLVPVLPQLFGAGQPSGERSPGPRSTP